MFCRKNIQVIENVVGRVQMKIMKKSVRAIQAAK